MHLSAVIRNSPGKAAPYNSATVVAWELLLVVKELNVKATDSIFKDNILTCHELVTGERWENSVQNKYSTYGRQLMLLAFHLS